MAPNRRSHYHTMSNPNTNALMSMLKNAVRSDNGPTAAGFKRPTSVKTVSRSPSLTWPQSIVMHGRKGPHLKVWPRRLEGKWTYTAHQIWLRLL